METSQIALNNSLVFLIIATSIILVVVGSFLAMLLWNINKLTKNLDETTTIVKAEIEPTLKELNDALKSINSIAQNADKQVDSLSKLFENILGASTLAFTRAKQLSGGVVKGLVKGFFTLMKLIKK